MMACMLLRGFQLRISRHCCSLQTVTLNQMMKNSLQKGQLENALTHFDQNPMSRNIFSWNIIIAGCVKYNEIKGARQLFDDMPERDVVSWNTWLSALQKAHDHEGIYRSYLELQRSCLRPSEYTFSIVISSVLGGVYEALIPQLHAQVVHLGHSASVFVGTALMRAYTSLGDHFALRRVFDDMLEKDISVWNALVFGYMDLGFTFQAQQTFDFMPERDVASWTIIVDGYLNNKQVQRARYIFNSMGKKNVVSWTAMISGYVKTGNHFCALELYLLMTRSNTRANQLTFSSIIAACAGHSDLVTGGQVHASIIKHGVPNDIVLSTTLIDMYAKCGNIKAAYCIFETMPNKNAASWNAIIGGYARNGLATRALDDFRKMISRGMRPNLVTFVNVLAACGHAGLVEEGERVFNCMEKVYGVKPEKEHYACMVDLYGKAGHLEKAKCLIDSMPFEPDLVVWSALLGACGLHLNSELSDDAANAIDNLHKDHPAVYSVFSKILGEKEAWSSLVEVKSMLEAKRIKKQKAGSWIG